jgi:hypothetical protein
MSDAAPTLRDLVARLARRELAKLGLVLTYEYRVVLQSGPAVELQAMRQAAGLPDLARVVARPGAAGYAPSYRLGSTVLVAFVEGDPARPFIAFGPEVGAEPPLEVAIDADAIHLGRAHGTVVREGDTISIASVPPVVGVVTITVGQGIPPAKSRVLA